MKKTGRILLISPLLIIVFFFSYSCAGIMHPAYQGDPAVGYRNAVLDAETAEVGEISRNLIAVVEENDYVTWGEGDSAGRVLVVTWTSWDGYDEMVGREMTLSREIWVTVVPELKEFAGEQFRREADFEKDDYILRLEQLLGLPPGNGKTKFVEIWVDPADLFRPSPDPEITDHEAELDFPRSAKFIAVSEEYVLWFNDLRAESYGENGYPWTRLGYTYDWGNPDDEIGLSEFVISEGAVVIIHSVTPNLEYVK